MKHVGLLLAALELPLVFLLARYLFDGRVATWAAFLTVFLPPMMSRVLYAQWPTLAGHLLDILAIFFAARMIRQPGNGRALALYGASGLASSKFLRARCCPSWVSSGRTSKQANAG